MLRQQSRQAQFMGAGGLEVHFRRCSPVAYNSNSSTITLSLLFERNTEKLPALLHTFGASSDHHIQLLTPCTSR